MAYRDDDRERFSDFDRERDPWERDERYSRERERDWDHGRDWDRGPDWEASAPRRPRRGYGHFERTEGVGAAAGYTGMGGPGWTGGGYGDPGFSTSGFGGPNYGPMNRWEGRPPEAHPWAEEEHLRGTWDRDVSGRWGSGDYRIYQEREREPQRGPYTGRGPKGYQRSDERIREEVSERLMDDPRLDASDIEVRVSNGEITLTGTVESRRMKRHAEDLAESVRGVNDVHNQLRIERKKEGDRELSLTPEAERLNRE